MKSSTGVEPAAYGILTSTGNSKYCSNKFWNISWLKTQVTMKKVCFCELQH